MKRIVALATVAALSLPALAQDPRVLTRGFEETPKTRLVGVLGSFGGMHAGPVERVAFLPDQDRAFSTSCDGAKLWDLAQGVELASFTVSKSPWEEEEPTPLAVSPLGRVALWRAGRAGIVRWRRGEPERVKKACDDGWGTRDVAISPDGRWAVIASYKGLGTLDPETGESCYHVASDERVERVAFVDADRVLAGGPRGTITLFDVASGKEFCKLEGHQSRIVALTASGNGKRALSSDRSNVLLWDLETGESVATFDERDVEGLAISPNGKRALLAGQQGLRLVDLETKKVVKMIATGYFTAVAFSPDGKRALTGGADHAVRLWDAASWSELWPARGHRGAITSLAPIGSGVLSTGLDGRAILWDAASNPRSGPKAIAPALARNACVLSPDASIVALSKAETIDVLDAGTGTAIGTIRQPRPGPSGTISTDGKRVLAGSTDGSVHLLDAKTGKQLARFSGLKGQILATALVPGGKRALSGDENGKLVLWDLDTYEEIRSLEVGRHRVVAASPDGKLALVATRSRKILLLSLETGAEIDRIDLASATDDATALAFAPDGRSFFAGTARGVVLHFELR